MVGGEMGSLWICFSLLSEVFAGPLHRVPRESEDYQNDYANYTANEVCFSEGEVFQKGDIMPNPGPCEECRCEPPSIVCNMIKCPTNNNGCRTIQRPNHCCPDYNCECDYNGQLYNDGERLDIPEEPCQVCYCKGGEVMCNSITCYHRDDCDPIQVAGQCCPKYENCPVRDMGSPSIEEKNVLVRSTNKTNYIPPKREMNPWLLTKLPPVSSPPPSKNSEDSTTEGGGVIIVSDWLTERRSTTEDATDSDVGRSDYNLEFTHGPDLTTEMRQDNSSDGTAIVKNSDTITPVDEVIFTRIDGQKVSNEANMEDQSTVPKKSQEFITHIIAQENLTISNVSQTMDSKTNVNEDLKRKIDFTQDKKVPIIISPLEITNHQTSTESTKIIVEPLINDSILSKSPEMKVTSTDSTTTQFNINSKNVQKGVVLGNIFGLDGLSLGGIEPETTTKNILEYHTTLNGEPKHDLYDLTENTLEGKTNEYLKGEKMKISPDDGPDRSDTTPSGVTDKDVTTPISTDISLDPDNENKYDHPTEFAKNKMESTSNNGEPITDISGKEYVTNANALSQLPISSEINTGGEIKIKRNNFDVPSMKDNSAKSSTVLIRSDVNEDPEVPTTEDTLNVLKNYTKLQNVILGYANSNTSDESPNSLDEDTTLPTTVSLVLESITEFQSTSDTPPVLELNSFVPFLQLGGHEKNGGHDETTVAGKTDLDIVVFDSELNVTSNSDSNKQFVNQKMEQASGTNDNIESDTTVEIVYPTTHLPLKPGDLKVIAEYLINDTIKTIPINNMSDYAPNPWLQGNLTSDEKMNSILSAANVSIAILNKTDDKFKRVVPESTTRSIEATRLENSEKEKNLSVNNALNVLKNEYKTGYIRGKSNDYFNYPKISSTIINDKDKSLQTTNLENTSPTANLAESKARNSISNAKENITSIPNLGINLQPGSFDTDRRFDRVNPADNFEKRRNEKGGFSTSSQKEDVTTASVTSSQQQKDQ